MISREQTTKAFLDVNGSFAPDATDRANRLKEQQRQQAKHDEDQRRQELKFVGWLLVAVFIGFLLGAAIV